MVNIRAMHFTVWFFIESLKTNMMERAIFELMDKVFLQLILLSGEEQ